MGKQEDQFYKNFTKKLTFRKQQKLTNTEQYEQQKKMTIGKFLQFSAANSFDLGLHGKYTPINLLLFRDISDRNFARL